MHSRILVFTCVVLVSGVLVACGGEDDSLPETPVVTPTTETTTADAGPVNRDEFIAEGDAICSDVLASATGIDATATDAGDQFGQLADLYDDLLGQLQAVGTPDDDTGLSDVYDSGAELVAAYEGAQAAAEAGDDSALLAAEESAQTAQADFGSSATAFGFEQCGDGSSTIGVPTAPTTPVPTDPIDPVPTEPVPTEPVPVEPAPVPEPEPAPEPAPPSGGAGSDPAPVPVDPGGSDSGGIGPG